MPPRVPDCEIEKSLAAFVVTQKRARYRLLLDSRKGRDKIRQSLAHSHDWDSRFLQPVIGKPQEIHNTLRKMGAPANCYVLSENDRDDAKRMDLLEALAQTVGYGMGTVICCVPGRLAFYEGESPNQRYILAREDYSDS